MEEKRTNQSPADSGDDLSYYGLFRQFWNWSFVNPDLVTPNHCAIYSFAIEHCNRLGWKDKFGFPSQMAMEAVGIKTWRTYIKCFNDLVEWGFFTIYQKSKNQYSSNIIGIVKKAKAPQKQDKGKAVALDDALQKHSHKQSDDPIEPDEDSSPTNKMMQDFVDYINTRLSRRYGVTRKYKGQFNARVKEGATYDDFVRAFENAITSKHHRENKFNYLTPEFLTRPDMYQKWSNAVINLPTTDDNTEGDI